MTYVDGFVLPVPKRKLNAYRKLAQAAGKAWRRHGALEYFECAGDDLKSKWSTLKFAKMARAKKGETVVFSFIVYKSKAHRNKVTAKVMKEFSADTHKEKEMPFDMKRMAYGGFKAIVDIRKR
ncbi:DUF1428 domain-containing protein [Candidatus Woesearchaeota archaeon]|nr:DUF1428 domain-containing protein [Candidatus Woesearchaeota archaeon]